MAHFMDGVQLPQGTMSHHEETVYILSLNLQEFLVLLDLKRMKG